MKFNLIWETETPDLIPDQRAVLARELAWLENSVDDADSVISHIVNLTSDWSGPSVTIHGKEDNTSDLFLTYNKETVWVTLDTTEEYKEE